MDLQLVEMVMPDIKVDYKEDNLVREETIQQEDYTNLEQAIEEVNIEYQTAELPANNVIDLSEYREKTSTEYTAKEETKIEVKTDSENSDLSHVNTESTTNTMDISREMTTLDNKVDEETEEKTVAKSDDKDYRPIETKKREYEDPKVIPFKPRDSYEKKIELPELRVQEKKEYNLEKKVLKQEILIQYVIQVYVYLAILIIHVV